MDKIKLQAKHILNWFNWCGAKLSGSYDLLTNSCFSTFLAENQVDIKLETTLIGSGLTLSFSVSSSESIHGSGFLRTRRTSHTDYICLKAKAIIQNQKDMPRIREHADRKSGFNLMINPLCDCRGEGVEIMACATGGI